MHATVQYIVDMEKNQTPLLSNWWQVLGIMASPGSDAVHTNIATSVIPEMHLITFAHYLKAGGSGNAFLLPRMNATVAYRDNGSWEACYCLSDSRIRPGYGEHFILLCVNESKSRTFKYLTEFEIVMLYSK